MESKQDKYSQETPHCSPASVRCGASVVRDDDCGQRERLWKVNNVNIQQAPHSSPVRGRGMAHRDDCEHQWSSGTSVESKPFYSQQPPDSSPARARYGVSAGSDDDCEYQRSSGLSMESKPDKDSLETPHTSSERVRYGA